MSIKAMYQNNTSSVHLNTFYTPWFETVIGIRQGDSLSPTLFNCFINDLALEVKRQHSGVNCNGVKCPILLYADDLALIAETENDLQDMLNTVSDWCLKWRLKANPTKSQVVHFRPF